MRVRADRVILGLLAISALTVGGWAQLAPHSFYTSFPGAGRHWVSVDGPFNEHLVRDVGGLNLALAAVTIFALIYVTRPLVTAAALAWLLYSVPHLAYHASHLDHYGTGDAIANVVSLGMSVLLPVLLLVVTYRDDPAVRTSPASGRTGSATAAAPVGAPKA